MIPRPSCPTCAAGLAAQAVGAIPPGVPVCPDHEIPGDAGLDDDEEGELDMPLLRQSLHPSLAERIVGWAIHHFARRAWPLIVAVWLFARIVRLLAWLARRPRLCGALGALTGLLWLLARYGWEPVALAGAGVAAILAGWAQAHRPSFDRYVRLPARSRRRRLRYRWRWQPAVSSTGLTIRAGRREHLPELLRVRCTDQVDRVRARMLPGYTVTQWAEACEGLAQTFGVLDARARSVPGRPHEVELIALVRDPLARVVPLSDPAPDPDLSALVVGIREDGDPLTLPVLGSHLLVAGVTGAGKGSVIWATLAALGPAILERRVLVWGIDPKGGAELMPGARLFDRFVYGGQTANGGPWQTQIADLLDEAVTVMQARLANMRARGIRKHIPTVDEPLLLIVVDEVASITAYVNDPALRRRIENALSLLLSQGRAPAVSCLLATQDPRKEVLAMRDLVPLRVALRTAEPVADLILGAGARARGAHTDRIDPALPGVGYILDEGQAEPVRVRFAYADDDAVANLAAAYAPAPVIAPALYRVS